MILKKLLSTCSILLLHFVVLSETVAIRESKGSKVVLLCHTRENGTSIMWCFQSTVSSFDDYLCTRSAVTPKYASRLTIDKIPTGYALTIHEVRASDAGVYSCIEDDGDGASHRTTLDVYDPDIALMHATEGSTVRLVCSTAARTVVTPVDWRYHRTMQDTEVYIIMGSFIRNDEFEPIFALDQDKTTLIIHNVSVSNSGIYYCIEDMGVGYRNTMHLSVSKCDEQTGRHDVTHTKVHFFVIAVVVVGALLLLLLLLSAAVVMIRQRHGYKRKHVQKPGQMKEREYLHNTIDTIELDEGTEKLRVAAEQHDAMERLGIKKFGKLQPVFRGMALPKKAINSLRISGVIGEEQMSDLNAIDDQLVKSENLLDIVRRSTDPKAFAKLREVLNEDPICSQFVVQLDTLALNDDDTINDFHSKVVVEAYTLKESYENVLGMAAIGDKLFVMRDRGNDQIDVYDITTRALRDHLTVSTMGKAVDMAACESNHCLYISDAIKMCVHKLSLRGAAPTSWNVGDKPAGLSVTPRSSVLVTLPTIRKLKEFTIDGHEIRQVDLDAFDPRHAIQLPSSQFLVWEGDRRQRISIVEAYNGEVVQSYRLSASMNLDGIPGHVAVDTDGFVYVADTSNSRVILLSPTLKFVREILNGNHLKKCTPSRLCLNLDRRLLFVENKDSNEVIALNV